MFDLVWTREARERYDSLYEAAKRAQSTRLAKGKHKSSRQEGLFKQVNSTLGFLQSNPRHPGLHTHQYYSLRNPYDNDQKVFEAYVQSKTPGAYRVFWCYGPQRGQITVIAITPHP